MSTTSWAVTPTPVLTTEQFPAPLASIVQANHRDHSALSILGIAPLSGMADIQSICRPRAALCFNETQIASLEAAGVIHALRNPHVANSYYVKYVPEPRCLWLKYQQIVGSRLLIAMSETRAALFEEIVRDYQPCAVIRAANSDDSLLAEIRHLTAKGQGIELPRQRLGHYARIKASLLTAGGRYARNGHLGVRSRPQRPWFYLHKIGRQGQIKAGGDAQVL